MKHARADLEHPAVIADLFKETARRATCTPGRFLLTSLEPELAGDKIRALESLSKAVDSVAGRPITLNATGAVAALLGEIGHTLTFVSNGKDAVAAVAAGNIDVVIMDVMMPKQDGFSLARSIRANNEHVPIVFVTAKSMQTDKIEGFNIGADDYITKPFSIEELMLRVQAILRRAKTSPATSEQNLPDNFPIGDYTFSYPNQFLRHPEANTQLTSKEAELLRLLCLHANHVMKREVALKTIWGDDSYFNGRSMDVFITKLRKYLKLDPTVEIMNVHGSGYKLVMR